MPDLWLNGRLADGEELASWRSAMVDTGVLTRWGGAIWKFHCDPFLSPSCEWVLSPALWEGERKNHFELKLRRQDPRCLVGSVTALGEWLVVAALPKQDWDALTRRFVREELVALRNLMGTEAARCAFDVPTQLFFQDAGLYPAGTKTLADVV